MDNNFIKYISVKIVRIEIRNVCKYLRFLQSISIFFFFEKMIILETTVNRGHQPR